MSSPNFKSRQCRCDIESDDEDGKTGAIVDEEPVAEEGQAGEEDEDLLTAIEISGPFFSIFLENLGIKM